jgi:hypothetical protein
VERELWTKTFKSSVTAEDDVEEDDVEMTVEGGASSGLGVCQGKLMSTKHTRMSLGCGDSSMDVLHLEMG